MTNATDRPRLGLRNYAGYAAGDMVNSFAFALQAMFLLIYYTDAVGLAPVPVAGIIFGVRLWSAVSDLIAGRLIDVTRSRWGRFHPWLVGGSLPMLLTGVALFTVPRFGGDRSLQYVYVAAAYAVHCFFFSLVVIAYSSLASAMTADAQERAKLGVWRNLSPVVVMIVVTALIAPLFTELAGRPAEIERFVVTVALLGSVIGFGLHLVCVRYSPERYRVAAAPPTVRETLRALSGNRPLVILCASQLILQTGLFTMVAAQAYYATYVLGDSAALVWIIAATSVATVVTLPILPRLAVRWGKKRTFVGAATSVAVTLAWITVMPPTPVVVVTSFFVLGVAQNLVSAVMWPFLADVTDYGEWLSGKRSDGGTVSVFFFFRRVSQASAGGLAGLGLALGGFVVGGAAQPDSAIIAIRWLVGAVPAVLALGGALVFLLYPLDETRHLAVVRDLGRV